MIYEMTGGLFFWSLDNVIKRKREKICVPQEKGRRDLVWDSSTNEKEKEMMRERDRGPV